LYQSVNGAKNCISAWTQFYISSNGEVSVCPRIHVYENLGNIIEQSFEDILEGKKLKALKKPIRV